MEAHVRADEGIERGPRDYTMPPLPPLPAIRLSHPCQNRIPQDFNDDQALDRIANGMLVSELAEEIGVTPSALYQRWRNHPRYLEARESGHEARLDHAEYCQQVADGALTLARARDIQKTRAWRAAVEFPARWGDKRHLTVEHVGDLGAKLRRAETVIEGESERVAPAQAAIANDSHGESEISD